MEFYELLLLFVSVIITLYTCLKRYPAGRSVRYLHHSAQSQSKKDRTLTTIRASSLYHVSHLALGSFNLHPSCSSLVLGTLPLLSVTRPWEAAAGSNVTLWWLCNCSPLRTHPWSLKCFATSKERQNSHVSQAYACPVNTTVDAAVTTHTISYVAR